MATSAFPALAINTQGESPLNLLGKIEQIRGQQQSQQMGEIQLEQARAVQQSQQTMMSLMAKNNGDLNQTLADAKASNKVLPNDILNLQERSVAIQTQAAKLTETQLANLDKEHDVIANGFEQLKTVPLEQRTPQTISDLAGTLARQGLDISKYQPALQSLAKDASDSNVNRWEVEFKGVQWAADNEIKQRQLGSMPSVAQAQAKNEAELQKAITDLNISNQQLANMPTAAEAKTTRMADLRKTYAETAEANAATAQKRAETALLGANPVKAFDPKTGQWYMSTVGQANANGYTNPVKVSDTEVKTELEATRQFDIMQASAADYQGSLQRIGIKGITDKESEQMASLLSDKTIFAGLGEHVLGSLGMARANDAITEMTKADQYNNLRPELQEAMVNYIRARAAIPLAQKAISGVGRMSEMAMKLEGQIIPTPIEGPSGMTKMNAFQTEITLGSQGLMRIPGVKTPEQIRLESQANTRTQMQSEAIQDRAQQAAIARQRQNQGGSVVQQLIDQGLLK